MASTTTSHCRRIDVTGSAITLSAWVKNSSFPTGVDQRFISKAVDSTEGRTYWMLGQTNDGQNRLQFRLRADRVTTTLIASTGTLPLNTWYHAAATYDGSTMRLYLNGTEVGSVAKSGSLSRGRNVSFDIGRSPDGLELSARRHRRRARLQFRVDRRRDRSSAGGTERDASPAGLAGPANQPPNVSLTAACSGAVFTAPASITLSANGQRRRRLRLREWVSMPDPLCWEPIRAVPTVCQWNVVVGQLFAHGRGTRQRRRHDRLFNARHHCETVEFADHFDVHSVEQ